MGRELDPTELGTFRYEVFFEWMLDPKNRIATKLLTPKLEELEEEEEDGKKKKKNKKMSKMMNKDKRTDEDQDEDADAVFKVIFALKMMNFSLKMLDLHWKWWILY